MCCTNRRSFRRFLEQAKFADLTQAWANSSVARCTYSLVPIWKRRLHPLPHVSTRAERTLFRCCFAHNDSRTSKHLGPLQGPHLCRHCKTANETIEHLFLQCPSIATERAKLFEVLPKLENPAALLRVALFDRRFSIQVQKFLLRAMPFEDAGNDP